jgi:hypothetical protein
VEVDIAQNLLADSITEADIFETNKRMTRNHKSTLLVVLARSDDEARAI